MVKRLWHRLTSTIAGGAIIIGGLSVASRFLGLARDRLLFSRFGAGDLTDAYLAGFKLPDFIFNIFVLGAVSAAFIPVFLEQWNRDGNTSEGNRAEAWRMTNTVLTITVLLMTVLAGIGALFAPALMTVIAPGFSPDKQALTVQLTRIMLVSILVFGVSNILGSVLNAFRRFVAYGLAPIVYNLGIIIGILWLAPRFGAVGLAWGVVLGAVLHCAVQIPAVRRLGFRFRPQLGWRQAAVQSVGRLVVPRMFGLAIYQIDQLVLTVVATTLAAGSLSVFTAANNLQYFPINVIGVSLAIASFPVFTQAVVDKQPAAFTQHFSQTVRRILFFIIPLSILILLLRAHIVRVVLGAGQFDWEDTKLTAQVLGFFSLSLFAQSIQPTLTRSFYAMKDTKTPVYTAIGAVLLSIVGSLTLSRVYGVVGLALSFSIVSIVHMMALYLILRHRVGDLDDGRIARSVLSFMLASAIMGVGVRLVLEALVSGVNQSTFVGIFLHGTVAGAVGVVLYVLLALLLRFNEVGLIRQWLGRMKRQLLNGSR